VTTFDEDTRISSDGAVTLTDRWTGMGGLPNGGYQLAICVRALARLMPYPDPMVVSAFFLRPGVPGPARVSASLLRAGRTTAFGEASLVQDGKETLRTTAAFTSLGDHNEQLFIATSPPQLPPPDECTRYSATTPGAPVIAGRFDYRFAEPPGWLRGQPSGNPAVEFWMRFADGREPDVLSLPSFVDGAPPAALELGVLPTTVELTVHLRARPAPGWLACRAVTRYVTSGSHEEDFEVWDSAGTLVAQSRQLCMIVR
jgi:acyl-coenzyme A thioesterase PaaI-like protein